jgi:hypothetical protein
VEVLRFYERRPSAAWWIVQLVILLFLVGAVVSSRSYGQVFALFLLIGWLYIMIARNTSVELLDDRLRMRGLLWGSVEYGRVNNVRRVDASDRTLGVEISISQGSLLFALQKFPPVFRRGTVTFPMDKAKSDSFSYELQRRLAGHDGPDSGS